MRNNHYFQKCLKHSVFCQNQMSFHCSNSAPACGIVNVLDLAILTGVWKDPIALICISMRSYVENAFLRFFTIYIFSLARCVLTHLPFAKLCVGFIYLALRSFLPVFFFFLLGVGFMLLVFRSSFSIFHNNPLSAIFSKCVSQCYSLDHPY